MFRVDVTRENVNVREEFGKSSQRRKRCPIGECIPSFRISARFSNASFHIRLLVRGRAYGPEGLGFRRRVSVLNYADGQVRRDVSY